MDVVAQELARWGTNEVYVVQVAEENVATGPKTNLGVRVVAC